MVQDGHQLGALSGQPYVKEPQVAERQVVLLCCSVSGDVGLGTQQLGALRWAVMVQLAQGSPSLCACGAV